MRFRTAVGCVLAAVGTVAVVANSYLLGAGAMRWAHDNDPFERWALGAGGAIVPTLLGTLPMLYGLFPSARGWVAGIGRGLLVAGLITMFLAYNFLMGTSNIAKLKEERIANEQHGAETVKAKKDKRLRLVGEIGDVPQHRPLKTVESAIAAEKTKLWFKNSKECAEPSSKDQREGCRLLQQLQGELEAARSKATLEAQVAELDEELAGAAPGNERTVDPFSAKASALTGWSQTDVRLLLAMLTPIALEVIGATCWKFAVALFGWPEKALQPSARPQQPQVAESPFNAAPLMSPDRANAASFQSNEEISAARRKAEWFFRECAKPVVGGSLAEKDWHEHYSKICRNTGDVPLSVGEFRRIASRFVPRISDVDGSTTYFEVLPVVPAIAA